MYVGGQMQEWMCVLYATDVTVVPILAHRVIGLNVHIPWTVLANLAYTTAAAPVLLHCKLSGEARSIISYVRRYSVKRIDSTGAGWWLWISRWFLMLQALPSFPSNWFWSVVRICNSQLAMLWVLWCQLCLLLVSVWPSHTTQQIQWTLCHAWVGFKSGYRFTARKMMQLQKTEPW